ncbi:hypothetical protein K435DRAFT_871218 [Dendrothele bispora CBS 962.96]|uniref:Uncharacterized protein n=1 Tax=Dendrothele bispora (strain CBS 962.96) TaxID=1314807 RepID=A0A4V4HCK3_DENBC|nr:hypothetical protein K435DRAFT_871218 [Dendrothele bispora CBS 962.96]
MVLNNKDLRVKCYDRDVRTNKNANIGRVSIDYIPPELISSIFCLSCNLDSPIAFQEPTANISIVNSYTALALSHVCSSWRDLALSTSKLWTKITVTERLSRINPEHVSKICRFAQLYLIRSENNLLDFIIEFPEIKACQPSSYDVDSLKLPEEAYELFESFYPIYKLFFQQASRWRVAYMNLDIDILQNRHRSHWPNTFPVLEDLEIRAIGNEANYSDTQPRLEISSAPLLRRLAHTGIAVSIGPDYSVAEKLDPIPTLESLVFSGTLSEENVSIACPNTSVTLFSVTSVSSRRQAQCLARKLRIDVHPNQDNEQVLGYLFESFILPNITHLHIAPLSNTINSSGIRFQSDVFLNLISDPSRFSATSLTHFTLASLFIKPAALLSILSNLPALTHFAFVSGDDSGVRSAFSVLTEAFFHSLAYRQQNQLLPDLKELHLAFGFGQGTSRGSEFTLNASKSEALFDMIESRSIAGLNAGKADHDMGGHHLQIVRLVLPSLSRHEIESNQGVVSWVRKLSVGTALDCTFGWAESRADWWRMGLGCWKDEEFR